MNHFKQFQAFFFYLLFSALLAGCNGGGGGSSGTSNSGNGNGDGNNEVENPTEPGIALESLTLSSIDSTLDLNDTLQLELTGHFSDDSSQDLSSQASWVVDNQDVLSVSSSGLITAQAAGTALITANIDTLSAQIIVKVRALDRLSLSPGAVSLAINASQTIQVTGIYTDNSTRALDPLVTWTSDNPDIASVSSSGLVTGNLAGSTEITAEYAGLSRSLTVTVSTATLQAITVSVADPQIPVGLSTGFSALGLYTDGSEQDITAQVEWSVSDTQFAEIDSETGVLTGLQAGTVSVSAAKEGKSESLSFTVSPATLTALQVTPATLSLVKGGSQELVVTAVFSDLSKQDVSSQVLWSSADESIGVAVEGGSLVQALGLGSTTLTASLLDQQASVTVTVSDAELVSLLLWPGNTTLPLGVSRQFVAQGLYTDNSLQDLSSQVTWLSSNEAAAQIGNSDDQKGLLESFEVGTTVISAVLGDIQESSTITIEDTLLASIEILPVKQTVASGTEAQIQAIGHYTNGARFDITNLVNWNTSSAKLISLSQAKEGRIKTLEAGDVILNAELQGITSLADVQVTSAVLQSIAIESVSNQLAVNSRLKLRARGYYSDETSRDISAQVTWQSGDNEVIAVANGSQSAGEISGLVPGEAMVSASLGEIGAERLFSVSDATLTGLQVSSTADSVVVNGSVRVSALAAYSDGSFQDASGQVNWLSSEPSIASVENTGSNKGLVTALSAGAVQFSASLAGIQSEPLTVQVTADSNAPVSLSFDLQPNVILSNGVDASQVNIQVLPSQAGSTVPDGTPVILSITEGDEVRTEVLSTIDGVASYTLSSTYTGMLELSASSGELSVNAGLLSTPGLWQAIAVRGFGDVTYENEILKKGSVFLASLRNLSNRLFNVEEVRIQYRDPLKANRTIQFVGSPFTDPEYISDGDLTAAEFTYIGYEMDFDTQGHIYQIIYTLTDNASLFGFTLGIQFDFEETEQTEETEETL